MLHTHDPRPGKRGGRRTVTNQCSPCSSAKDKAILEAAYNANPKPDKAARLDIVKRVSLNEKEVQVRDACPMSPIEPPTRHARSIGRLLPRVEYR